jgi:anti-sigma factor RsiW
VANHLSRELLLRLLEGELSTSATPIAEDHLTTCSWCRAELERLERRLVQLHRPINRERPRLEQEASATCECVRKELAIAWWKQVLRQLMLWGRHAPSETDSAISGSQSHSSAIPFPIVYSLVGDRIRCGRGFSSTSLARYQHAVFVLVGILAAGTGILYGVRQSNRAHDLAERQTALVAHVEQLEKQLSEISARIRPLQKHLTVVATLPSPELTPTQTASATGRQVDDRFWKQAENGSITAKAHGAVTTARTPPKSTKSARIDPNKSVARTPEEVVAFQKLGGREFRQFDIAQSKELRRIGPVSLALRKADTRHQQCDIDLLVGQTKLGTKRIKLYEPFNITVNHWPYRIELVVNKIGKNRVRGYVSQPKYKKMELAFVPPRAPS